MIKLLFSASVLVSLSAALPPEPKPDGTCKWIEVGGAMDHCWAIAESNDIYVSDIELWNKDTFHFVSCDLLLSGIRVCVSPGNPPPVKQDPSAKCGPAAGGRRCPMNACCSGWGHCGLSPAHCRHTDDVYKLPCLSDCEDSSPISLVQNKSQTSRRVGIFRDLAMGRERYSTRPDDLSWDKYTHAILADAYLDVNSPHSVLYQERYSDVAARRLLDIRRANPDLKVLARVGGWWFTNQKSSIHVFPKIISSPSERTRFVANLMEFVDDYGFDGVDIYYIMTGEKPHFCPPRHAFTSFIREIRAGFSSSNLELSVTLSPWFLECYELEKLEPLVDFFNIGMYDFFGSWSIPSESVRAKSHTSKREIEASIKVLTRARMSLEKINFGLYVASFTYKLLDPKCKRGLDCEVVGAGKKGPITQEQGVWSLSEIQELLRQRPEIKVNVEEHSGTSWFTYAGDLFFFDSPENLEAKAEIARQSGFGGIFEYPIDNFNLATVSFGEPTEQELYDSQLNNYFCSLNSDEFVEIKIEPHRSSELTDISKLDPEKRAELARNASAIISRALFEYDHKVAVEKKFPRVPEREDITNPHYHAMDYNVRQKLKDNRQVPGNKEVSKEFEKFREEEKKKWIDKKADSYCVAVAILPNSNDVVITGNFKQHAFPSMSKERLIPRPTAISKEREHHLMIKATIEAFFPQLGKGIVTIVSLKPEDVVENGCPNPELQIMKYLQCKGKASQGTVVGLSKKLCVDCNDYFTIEGKGHALVLSGKTPNPSGASEGRSADDW